MFRFEGLEIWQLATDYAHKCYDIADGFPAQEKFALTDQLRRAAVSISNNIAEGSTGSPKNFGNYLERALGSTFETVNILSFALKRNYISSENKESLYQRC